MKNVKRTSALVLAIVMLFSTFAFAAELPSNYLVIGDKAIDLDYAMNNQEAFNKILADYLAAGGSIDDLYAIIDEYVADVYGKTLTQEEKAAVVAQLATLIDTENPTGVDLQPDELAEKMAAIEALIAELPEAAAVTAENLEAVKAQMTEIEEKITTLMAEYEEFNAEDLEGYAKYLAVANKIAELEKPVEEVTVVKVSAINDINVAFGTALEDLELPETVTLELSNETTAEVAVVLWEYEDYDENVAGTYTFVGSYELPEGVTGEKPAATVKVIVGEYVDTVAPVITLNGEAEVTVELGAEYVDAGATATDNVDGDVEVTVDSSAVNTSVEGTYAVTYTATDAAGNQAIATRTVIVAKNESIATTVEVAAVSVEENKTATPVVTVKDQYGAVMADQTVTYASSDVTVFTVATDGTITAGAYVADANTATLTATVGEVSGEATVTVTEDTTLPTATLTVVDNKHIDVTFSEKVTGLDTITNNYSLVKASNTGVDLLDDAGATAVVIEAGIKVRLRIEDGVTLAPAQYLFYINPVTAGNIADLAGNEVYEGTEIIFTPSSQVLTDVTAPILLTAAYDSSTRQLVLTFDENVIQASYDATKVTFDGVTLASTDTAVVVNNVATITLTQTKADELNLADGGDVVLAGAFKDAAGNAASATKAVTIVTPPTLVDATATGSSFDETTRVLTIKFNEAVTLEDVTQISLDDNGDAAKALTVADKVVASTDGTDTLQIQLSTTTYNLIKDNVGTTVGLTIAAGAVKDTENTANKAIANVEIGYTQDIIAPEITGITYNNQTNVLTITMNELLAANVDASWSIDTDPTTGAITLVAATGGAGGVAPAINLNSIVATIDTANSSTIEGWYAAGKIVKVYTTDANAVTDLAGNQVGLIALADGTSVELVDQIAPEVASTAVSTLSATKFILAFNEVMDKATAELATNYVIYDNQNDKNIAVTKAELQADGVTVYLTTAEALIVPNVNNYVITVNNVKDVSLNRIANNTTKVFTLGAVDSTAPVVASTVFTTNPNTNNDTIAVTFTEAGSGLEQVSAETLANYTVKNAAGIVINLTGADIALAGNTVTITLKNGVNLETGANYTIDVANVMDNAENVMTAFEGTATAAIGDATAPTVSSVEGRTTATGDEVVITLSEAVNKTLAETIANYTIKTNTGGTTLTDGEANSIAYVETDVNKDGVVDICTVTVGYDAGKLVTDVDVVLEGAIKDLAGNADDSGTANGGIVDGVSPTISSVTATTVADEDNDTIVVVFDENVVAASVEDKGNWVIKDATGTVIPATSYVIVATDATTATITFSGYNLQTGATYTVEINGVMDAAGNEVVDSGSDVAEGDETAFTFTTAEVTATGAGTTVVISTAGDKYDAATITKGMFTITSATDGLFNNSGDETSYVVASVVYDATGNTITINLTTALEAADATAEVKIDVAAGIEDLAGNVSEDITVEHVID